MKKKIAFICVHNSCRSQIAEALGKKYLSDSFECYSAGTETKPQINPDAVRLMKELYDTMQNGTAPACSGNEGLDSAVFALAIDRAAQTGSMVDLEPIWKFPETISSTSERNTACILSFAIIENSTTFYSYFL